MMHRVKMSAKQLNKDATAFPPIWMDTRPTLVMYTFRRELLTGKSSSQILMAFTSRHLGEGIIYIPDHCVLFCTTHQSAIPIVELKYHLRGNRDHKLSPEKWLPIRHGLKSTIAELDIPDNDSEPLPFLPVLDGKRCLKCLKCLCIRGT